MAGTGKRKSRHNKKDWIAAYIFILPLTLGILIFYIFPFLQNVWFSFNDVNKFNIATFCGLDNFKQMLTSKELWVTFGNTLRYVILVVPIGLMLSLIIAALLNTKIKGKSLYRTVYFIPSVTMAAAVGLVFKWIFNDQVGVLNGLLRWLGLPGQAWLTNPKIAPYAVIVVGIWMTVGYNMIILLAGIQGIPKTYYEAASIDGAGPVKKFFKITLPLLSPTIFFVVITSVISGFQVFDQIYMMIGKTSLAYESTQSMVMMFYRNAFDYGYKGYAASISIFIFAVIMIVTVVQMIGQKKWVHYE